MSIVDNKTVDGIALTDDNNGIILLIADHMDWRDEYQHLVMLQEKINVYITFLEQKQYEDIYKGENITYGIIEIHFLYSLTANAEKFLQSVQNQVAELSSFMEERTTYTSEEITDNIVTEWYVREEEALEKGVCHEVIEDIEVLL